MTKVALHLCILVITMASCLAQRADRLAGTSHPTAPSIVGEEIPIAVRSHDEEEDPIAAWGHSQYLVVWQSTRNGPTRIYATRITGAGAVLHPDGFPLSSSPADQLFPAVAWGEPTALVVWQDLRSRKQWEIFGARVDSAGRLLDPENLPVSVGAGNRRHPAVAWDGDAFLVVWMEEAARAGWDIVGARVTQEGRVLDPEGVTISHVSGDQARPDIAWTGKNYLVVWMDGRQGAADIYGARIDRDSRLLDPQGFQISAAPGEQAYPSVAWDGANAVVVWVDQRGSANPLLYGARIDGQGAVLDPGGVLLSVTPRLHMFPDITCRSDDCLVIWEEEAPSHGPFTKITDVVRDVSGMRLDPRPGRPLASSAPIPLAPRALGNHFSRVSTDGHRYLVVWKDYRSGIAAGFGRLVDLP